MLKIKRIYESPEATDGYRVLIDRLWPRGVSKEKAALDLWLKDAAPSPELREWFGHKPERFEEFKVRYGSELAANPAIKDLLEIVKSHPTVTLLYAAHDETHNHAQVLADFLQTETR